jgi:hypothetical protein
MAAKHDAANSLSAATSFISADGSAASFIFEALALCVNSLALILSDPSPAAVLLEEVAAAAVSRTACAPEGPVPG